MARYWIVPGVASHFVTLEWKFDSGSMEKLRALVEEAKEKGFGVILKGRISIVTHPCDILRQNHIPSRMEY
ncbi:MAG: hypothetical protein Q8R25_01415 [bacterium]|nr:hypothetical protein [bacterium]